ncbi:MAG: cysteine hydrolase [Acetobacter sp.]|nr:cysteine hydrolase [Acetobacter sp.]
MKFLIVIDMQNDFISGALGTKEAQAVMPNVVARINQARANGEQVIFTRDTHYENTYMNSVEGKHLPVPHCILNSEGWNLHPDIAATLTGNDILLDKEGFGAYDLPHFIIDRDEDENDPITEITVIGLCTDICVIANAVVLKSFFVAPAFPVEITVDASCCAGVTLESHKRALESMKTLHINVINEEG